MHRTDYIAGLRRHDRDTLKTIYARYARRVERHVLNNGGTSEDAKDVFHDALMIIYQKVQEEDFVLTSRFFTYLFGICRFVWDRKRRKKANQTVTMPEDSGCLVADPSIIESLERRERHQVFERALRQLGTTCRNILELFFAGRTMDEIAQALTLKNAHTARTRKYRCQKQLEDLIKQDPAYAELKSPAGAEHVRTKQ